MKKKKKKDEVMGGESPNSLKGIYFRRGEKTNKPKGQRGNFKNWEGGG